LKRKPRNIKKAERVLERLKGLGYDAKLTLLQTPVEEAVAELHGLGYDVVLNGPDGTVYDGLCVVVEGTEDPVDAYRRAKLSAGETTGGKES